MAAGDVYRMTVTGSGMGHVFQNVVALRMITSPDPTTALLQVFADGLKEAVRGYQHQAITWRSWRAVQVFGSGVTYGPDPCERTGGKAFEAVLTGTLVGGDPVADALPPQCSLVITQSTGLIGRRKRGRLYVFGLGETNQVAGNWSSAILTGLTTSWSTFFNKYKESGTDPNLQLGIWSDRTAFGCEWRGDPPVHTQVDSPDPDNAFTAVTGFTVRPYVHTQRRRAIGVGR